MDDLRPPERPFPVAGGGTALLFALLAPLALGGCRNVDAKVWNLREVHDASGATKRTGRLRTDLQQLVIEGVQFSNNKSLNLFGMEDQKAKPIEDPDGVTLENLLELAKFDASDPRVQALQVEMFGWLAVDDRYVLARERCLLELGPLGRDLGVEAPVRRRSEPPPATPEEVGDALQRLVETVTLAVRGIGIARASDVEEDCAAIDALELDREGLRRLISAITILLHDGRADLAAMGVLPELHRSLQREFVAQTFAQALVDPHPVVRAAALEAATIASGNSLPGLLQGALIQDSAEPVRLRCLRLLELNGIPSLPPELAAEGAEGYEDDWIALLIELLRGSMEGPVSTATCRTLAVISDAPFESLRPEDWVDWWLAEQAGGSS